VTFLAIGLILIGCAPTSSAPPSTGIPIDTPTAAATVELRVRAAANVVSVGDSVDLVAEAHRSPGEPWDEVRAIWTSEPGALGVVQVPAVQGEGRSRVAFLARGPGRVSVAAEPVVFAGRRVETTLEIVAAPTPTSTTATATPSATSARPTPAAKDSSELRQAITSLDQLDRQVLGVADTFVGAFRALASDKVQQADFCRSVGASRPRMDRAVADIRAHRTTPELVDVHREYVAVAGELSDGLAGLERFCQTNDTQHVKTYMNSTSDAIARSVMAKQKLDDIATAIGMPIPRSTRAAPATPTP
jgi:hypothetical protein